MSRKNLRVNPTSVNSQPRNYDVRVTYEGGFETFTVRDCLCDTEALIRGIRYIEDMEGKPGHITENQRITSIELGEPRIRTIS